MLEKTGAIISIVAGVLGIIVGVMAVREPLNVLRRAQQPSLEITTDPMVYDEEDVYDKTHIYVGGTVCNNLTWSMQGLNIVKWSEGENFDTYVTQVEGPLGATLYPGCAGFFMSVFMNDSWLDAPEGTFVHFTVVASAAGGYTTVDNPTEVIIGREAAPPDHCGNGVFEPDLETCDLSVPCGAGEYGQGCQFACNEDNRRVSCNEDCTGYRMSDVGICDSECDTAINSLCQDKAPGAVCGPDLTCSDDCQCGPPAPTPTPTNKPDLTINSIETDPSPVNEGDQVRFKVTVTNKGGADASAHYLHLYFSGASGLINRYEVSIPSLVAGEERLLTIPPFSYWTAVSGDYTLKAVIDEGDDIDEIDEGNNDLSTSFTVSGPTPTPAATPTPTPSCGGFGDPCKYDEDCCSGNCEGGTCGCTTCSYSTWECDWSTGTCSYTGMCGLQVCDRSCLDVCWDIKTCNERCVAGSPTPTPAPTPTPGTGTISGTVTVDNRSTVTLEYVYVYASKENVYDRLDPAGGEYTLENLFIGEKYDVWTIGFYLDEGGVVRPIGYDEVEDVEVPASGVDLTLVIEDLIVIADFNGDGVINTIDFAYLVYQSNCWTPDFDPITDLDDNGRCDAVDVSRFFEAWRLQNRLSELGR